MFLENVALVSALALMLLSILRGYMWIRVPAQGEAEEESNMSEHHCSPKKEENSAAWLESKQKSICAKEEKSL